MPPTIDKDARMLLREFVKLDEGESFTLLIDQGRRTEAEAVCRAAQEMGAEPVIVDISHQVDCLLAGNEFWVDPPPAVAAAVQNSNVTVAILDETYGFRLDHKVRQLISTGDHCSLYKVDLGMGDWGLAAADIIAADEAGKILVSGFAGADVVHITSQRGTDVTLSIRNRECLVVPTVPERGMPYAIPIPLWGEYNWAPVEASVEGKVVIDGITEATPHLHVVAEPVTWTVVNGRVVDVAGDVDADDFRTLFAVDDGASMIGELGVGGNPRGIVGTETEKALLGTVHFGLGQNDEYPGGSILSKVHVDGGVRAATIEVDGKTIMVDGSLVD
jgi:hypothetical protein